MQTIEAIIDTMGNVTVLSDVRLPNNRKALVTILDEEPVENGSQRSKERKEKLIAAFRKAQEVNIFGEIDNPDQWLRKLRNEWDSSAAGQRCDHLRNQADHRRENIIV